MRTRLCNIFYKASRQTIFFIVVIGIQYFLLYAYVDNLWQYIMTLIPQTGDP